MANDYQQTSISGTSYQRGRSLYFENPKDRPPTLLIREERVINLVDRELIEPAGELRVDVTDLSTEFALRHPETNELLHQTATYQDLYVLLFSLYWHLAEARDAAAAEPPKPLEFPEPPFIS